MLLLINQNGFIFEPTQRCQTLWYW